jgi:hypothetical protein
MGALPALKNPNGSLQFSELLQDVSMVRKKVSTYFTATAGLFVPQRTGSHSTGISCTTHEFFSFPRKWFCVVRGPKPPLHRHN